MMEYCRQSFYKPIKSSNNVELQTWLHCCFFGAFCMMLAVNHSLSFSPPGYLRVICILCLLKALCLFFFTGFGSGGSVSMWTGFSGAGVRKTSAVTSLTTSSFASVLFIFCSSFSICFSRTLAATASLCCCRCCVCEDKGNSQDMIATMHNLDSEIQHFFEGLCAIHLKL